MRKLVLLALVLVSAGLLWAGGQQAKADTVVIGIWDKDIDMQEEGFLYADHLFKDWPDPVEFRFYPVGDGAEVAIQLDVAAGTPPDIYTDYIGRVNIYANERYAHDLTAHVNVNDWDESFLAMTTKGGRIWALPTTAWVMPMILNKTVMEEIGMFNVVRDRSWTIAEFVESARRAQALGVHGFGFFAGGGAGGDYWNMALLPSFGASLYRDNQVVIGEPAGRLALQWHQDFVNEGLAAPGAAGMIWSDMYALWAEGKLLAISGTANRVNQGVEAYEAGTTDRPFEGWITGWPLAPGVDQAPMAVGPDAVMAFRTGSDIRPEVLRAIERMAGPLAQGLRVAHQYRVPSLREPLWVEGPAWEEDWFTVTLDLLRQHGAWDIGLGLTEYSRIRPMVPEMFQKIYSGGNVDEAIDAFIREANEILQ